MMDRRQALVSMAAALGAAATAASGGALWARARNGDTGTLNDTQLATITLVCDLMIPRTDTPGAVDAAVPAFVGLMISEWAAGWRKESLLGAIDGLAASGIRGPGDLAAIDDAAFGGKPDDTFSAQYKELKRLIVWSYYTSEEGATEELVFEAIPGPFHNVPLSEVGRAWAT